MYELLRQQYIEAPLETVFGFFRRPENLESITPAWLGFAFRSPPPSDLAVGSRIDYTIRLAGIPLHWTTLISEWDPPYRFVDLQERGPYAAWEHTHSFEPLGDGVLMTDRVRYALPFGWLGRLTHAIAVKASLDRIFDHRFQVIRSRFAGPEGAGPSGSAHDPRR